MIVADWIHLIERLAPLDLAEEWDRVGLEIGRPDRPADRVLVALTLTPDVAEQALSLGVGLIVVHHPVMFRPLSEIRTDTARGRMVAALLAAEVAVYAAHTNLDNAPGGLNDWLAEAMGILPEGPLVAHRAGPPAGTGRHGPLRLAVDAAELLSRVRERLHPRPRVIGRLPARLTRAAVWTGSGAEAIEAAARVEADVLITGDLKYHAALTAVELGLPVIDAGHFGTEYPLLTRLVQMLQAHAPAAQVSLAAEADPFWVDH
ncbi:MAG TPA: Nif3-like dinuclear metal center hexameric protein [Limnochordia bacterium]